MGTYFNKDDYFLDSVGNVLLEGDLVRMRHFSTNKKKYYMYKTVTNYVIAQSGLKKLMFKCYTGKGVFGVKKGEYTREVVVVQRAKFHNNPSVDELKRNPSMRD